MHDCVRELLSKANNPEEEETESLCTLVTTVGESLDNQKGRLYMDVYFTRMKDLAKDRKRVPSRLQFMLQVSKSDPCAVMFLIDFTGCDRVAGTEVEGSSAT